ARVASLPGGARRAIPRPRTSTTTATIITSRSAASGRGEGTPRTHELDTLPPDTVQPLGALTAPELRAWAQRTGQRFQEIRFNAGADKKAVLRTIAHVLGFPSWFAATLAALYDSLTDLPDRADAQSTRGWVIVLGALPKP